MRGAAAEAPDLLRTALFEFTCVSIDGHVAAALAGHQETLTQRAALKLRGKQIFKRSQFAMH